MEVIVGKRSDRSVIDSFLKVGRESDLPDSTIWVVGPDGAFSHALSLSGTERNETLDAILRFDGSLLGQVSLRSSNREVVSFRRQPEHVFDRITMQWERLKEHVEPFAYAKIVGLVQREFKQLNVGVPWSETGIDSYDKLVKGRLAELDELRRISSDILKEAHAARHALDREYADKQNQLEAAFAERRQAEEEENKKLREDLNTKEEALKAREAEIDRTDSKNARRQLRKDLLKLLQTHSEKFELTAGTRRLRWPMMILLAAILGLVSYLLYGSFSELVAVLSAPDAPWWKIAVASGKQLALAAAFIVFATYALGWMDRWSRRHADAEFRFKQLELDINRASWVVETALEWSEVQKKDVPPELLSQLSKNLFSEAPGPSEAETGADALLSLILGSGANLKMKTPAGEVEFDKKGLRDIAKKVGE